MTKTGAVIAEDTDGILAYEFPQDLSPWNNPDNLTLQFTVDGWVEQSTLYPASSINKLATTAIDRQATVAAAGAVLPLIYGEQRVGAKISLIVENNGYIYVQCLWAIGVNEGVVSIFTENSNDITSDTDKIVAHYPGSLTQTADPTLASILPGYSDTLIITKNGHQIPIAYSVLRFPAAEYPSSIETVFKGRTVYDVDDTGTYYTRNPAKCLYDFLSSPIYGPGLTVNESSVSALKALWNTLLADGEKHRQINLAIDSMATVDAHIGLLRTYASCFVVQDGSEIKLVPDAATVTIDRTLNDDDFILDSASIEKTEKKNIPTVVTVVWTNTEAVPWRDDRATAELVGVSDGSVEYRESIVQLQGITTYSQAYREAVERLNKLNFSNIIFEADTFDESLQDQIGDIHSITHRYGLTAKTMRLASCGMKSPGRWHPIYKEHDNANYSEEIQTEPSEPDTSLPSPLDPNPPTSLILSEDVYTEGTIETVSRIFIQWTAPAIGAVEYYRVKIIAAADGGDQLVYETTTTSTEIYTDIMVNEGKLHTVSVYTYSGLALSVALSDWILLEGAATTPDVVQSFAGIEAGGKVFLSWSDTNALPIRNYEIRYGNTSSTWDSGSIQLVIVDALAYVAQGIPAGDYKFHIKANSYYNNLSATEATITITITIDSDYLAETLHGIMDEDNSSNMVRFYKSRHNTLNSYVQSDGTQSFANLYFLNMSSYNSSDGLFSYMESLAYTWKTKAMDFDADLTGVWTGDMSRIDYGTGSQDSLLLSTDGISFDTYEDMTAETTARYAKLSVYDTSGKILVTNQGSMVNVSVLSIKENGSITSSIHGAKTVGLNNRYSKVINITITPVITDGVTATANNIFVSLTETNYFDIYVFDENNELIEVECFWRFEGV